MRWIRVDTAIADSPMIGAVADDLGDVPLALAVGLCTLVFAKMAEFAKDGNVSQVPDSTLERWATWEGKRKAFAQSFRRRLCDETGAVIDWERCNGAAIRESISVAQRVKKHRGKDDVTPPVTPPKRVTSSGDTPLTGRDGTLTLPPENSGKDPTDIKTPSTRHVEKPAAVAGNETATIEPSAVVTRFMVRFYRTNTPERRADVARQMTSALTGAGVEFTARDGTKKLARAVDDEHLDDACLEVMEDPPRDNNAAWVFVMYTLNDTYLEVMSARAKALERATDRVRLPEGMAGEEPAGATPIRAALAGVLEGLDVPRGTSSEDV